MLRDDPIISKLREYLPTEAEVELTNQLLQRPANSELRKAVREHIAIGGCEESTLWRFCWQARQDHKKDQKCAEGALDWLRQCAEARQRHSMDSVLRHGPFTNDFRELYLAALPFSFHKVDRSGHPVYISRLGRANLSALQRLWAAGRELAETSGMPVNAAVLFHFRAMEYATSVVMGRETTRQGRVVDRMLIIFDLAGLGPHHWDASLKAFLGSVSKDGSVLFPETMHATVLANVPWLVARAVWPMVRSLLHPVTQRKFVFASPQEMGTRLQEFVEPADLPPYLGGRCTCAECASGRQWGGSMQDWEQQEGLLRPDSSRIITSKGLTERAISPSALRVQQTISL